MTPRKLRDKWEEEALRIFTAVYRQQWLRTRRVLNDHEIEEFVLALRDAYRLEPSKMMPAVVKLFEAMARDVAIHTQAEVSTTADPDDLNELIVRLAKAHANTFTRGVSERKLRLMYSIIEESITTPGVTKGEIIARIKSGFDFVKNPTAAATTESTRLVAESRIETFKATGIEQFNILTRNDSRVRAQHAQWASEGPYPVTRTDRVPPFQGSEHIGCRCTIVAARVQV